MVRSSWMNPPPGVKCVTKFEDIVSAKEGACDTESGYSWFMVDLPPDANEIKSMCQSVSCRAMFESMRAAAPTECVTKSGWYLYADMLNPILKGCETVPKPASGEAPYNGTASSTTTSAPAVAVPAATTASGASPTVAPVSVTASPAITTATPVVDTGSQIVNAALSRGTIIAILSAGAVVLTTVSALIRFCYNRRQEKKKRAAVQEKKVADSPATTPTKPAQPSNIATPVHGGYGQSTTPTKPTYKYFDEDSDDDYYYRPKDKSQTNYGAYYSQHSTASKPSYGRDDSTDDESHYKL